MGPSIGRSLKEGFLAANRSWVGMGLLLAGWALALVCALLIIFTTSPPKELAETEPTAAPLSGKAGPPAAPPAAPAAAPTVEGTDLFRQMASPPGQAGTTGQATQTAPAVAAKPSADDAARAAAARRDRIVGAWFRHAWPALLIGAVLLFLANVWMSGAQIGYVAKQVRVRAATTADFFRSGAQAFGAILGASLLTLLLLGVVALALVLVAGLFTQLSHVLPEWVLILIGVLLCVVALIGVVWLSIRLACWFVAIAADHHGPMAGLRVAFRASRGRWWRLAGLAGLLLAISYGILLILGVVGGLAGLLGGPVGLVLSVISRLAEVLVNIYLGFVGLGAFVRFYEDTKPPAPTETAPTT